MELAGIGADRLHLAWVSSAEAQRFAEVATDTVESVRKQGAFDPKAFALQLNAAERTLGGETLRWIVGKEVALTKKGDVYGRKWDEEQFGTVLNSVLEREYHKNLIYCAVSEGFTSVREIGKKIGLDLKRISYLLADLEKTNMVAFQGMEDKIPVFAAL